VNYFIDIRKHIISLLKVLSIVFLIIGFFASYSSAKEIVTESGRWSLSIALRYDGWHSFFMLLLGNYIVYVGLAISAYVLQIFFETLSEIIEELRSINIKLQKHTTNKEI